jgi:hypothetical protein
VDARAQTAGSARQFDQKSRVLLASASPLADF